MRIDIPLDNRRWKNTGNPTRSCLEVNRVPQSGFVISLLVSFQLCLSHRMTSFSANPYAGSNASCRSLPGEGSQVGPSICQLPLHTFLHRPSLFKEWVMYHLSCTVCVTFMLLTLGSAQSSSSTDSACGRCPGGCVHSEGGEECYQSRDSLKESLVLQ